MWKIGLTGSIATGKSTTLGAFAALGIPTFSADGAVHALYAGEAAPVVEALFPGTSADGKVDRAELSKRLLADPTALARLEAAIHPLVRDRIAAFLKESESFGAPIAVVDIPLLFEGGHDWGLEAVAVTVVDPAIQRQRALARPGMSVEKLDAILARQMPQAEKKARADYILDTSKSVEVTAKAVKALVLALRASPQGI